VDWDLIRSIFFVVFGVATTVSAALVGLLFGSLRTLRDTAGDLRERVKDLETERTKDKSEKAELHAENSLLKSMVTGKVEWVALTDQLEEHHRQALQWWKLFGERLEEISTKVERR